MTFKKKLARFYRVSDKTNDAIYDAIYDELKRVGVGDLHVGGMDRDKMDRYTVTISIDAVNVTYNDIPLDDLVQLFNSLPDNAGLNAFQKALNAYI
ncbi:MAG: hypothetical protein IEMM0002_1460 [bacterium]|nr:MAG: hypothetical protein IEMM0002_1460 [bacterium]